MSAPGTLLLRTPDPRPHEGILGYVLRVSEENGYDSPWHVYRLAGYTQDELFRAGFEPDKLAAVVGKDPLTLMAHGYQGRSTSGQAQYQINGLTIGRSLRHRPFRLKRPAICPHCIEENGFAHVSWELSAMVACPKHKVHLLDTCRSCRSPISWFRPGLLTCKCGASLASCGEPAVADTATVEFMQVLHDKITGELPRVGDQTNRAIPAAHLAAMPLSSLLHLASVLEKMNGQPDEDTTWSASEVFADWPRGFHEYLRRMGQRGIAADVKGLTLYKRFKTLRSCLFKARRIEGLEFMYEEFIRFGLNEWDESLVDARVASADRSGARFVCGSAASSQLGVMPITARRWIDKGLLQGKRVRSARASRYVVDACSIQGASRSISARMQAREAGKFAGLPVSVLLALKRSGHYSLNPIVNKRMGFWPEDLQALKERILATVELPCPETVNGGQVITLGRILSVGKLGAAESKGAFMAEVLEGSIAPCGKHGESIHDLLFRIADVENFRVRYMLTSSSEYLTADAAAEIIGCRPHSIGGLAAGGHIRRKRGKSASIVRSSAIDFAKHWRPLAAVAKDLETSPQGLALRANSLGIHLLRVRLNAHHETLFLAREDVNRLKLHDPRACA